MPFLQPSAAVPVVTPKGTGFRVPTADELVDLGARGMLDLFTVWEPPRRHGTYRYVIGGDVADGLGQDRSVAEVIRVGTIDEPAEQVAEFASDTIAPMPFAYVLQAIGDWYRDSDGVEALVAIETNNHGLSTQDTLQLHLGYTHFYRWEYYDLADPSARYSTKIGWYTSPRTRPILLDKFKSALTTVDPVTGMADLVTHSAFLHDELQDFQTEGALWEAQAARGAHDDRVMALAIAYYVSWRLQGGETEPLEERRRRRTEEAAARQSAAAGTLTPSWRNHPTTAAEAAAFTSLRPEDQEDVDQRMYDLRATDDDHAPGFFWN